MIPFEDLVAALDSFVARTRGGAAAPSGRAPSGGSYDPPTTEHQMPDVQPSLRSHGAVDDDSTIAGDGAGPAQPIYDDRSNELDVSDVLDDENS
jgi:hypothetical protein